MRSSGCLRLCRWKLLLVIGRLFGLECSDVAGRHVLHVLFTVDDTKCNARCLQTLFCKTRHSYLRMRKVVQNMHTVIPLAGSSQSARRYLIESGSAPRGRTAWLKVKQLRHQDNMVGWKVSVGNPLSHSHTVLPQVRYPLPRVRLGCGIPLPLCRRPRSWGPVEFRLLDIMSF